MNYYQDELTAKYNRQRVREEFERIHLEDQIVRLRENRPSLFSRTMHNLASWMISTGEELHERYEIPTEHCHQTPSGSFA